jgi:hypothetical protein
MRHAADSDDEIRDIRDKEKRKM